MKNKENTNLKNKINKYKNKKSLKKGPPKSLSEKKNKR